MWSGDRYKFGNGNRGYIDLESTSAKEAWEFGCSWFNKKYPDGYGKGVVLLESTFVKVDKCDLDDNLFAKYVEKYVTIAAGNSDMEWDNVYTPDC